MTFLKRVQGAVASDGRRLCIFVEREIFLSLCNKKNEGMSIQLSSFNGKKFFTSDIPDIDISADGGEEPTQVTITCDGDQVLQEQLWPVGGTITLMALGELLEPYARKRLVASVTISATAPDGGGTQTAAATVLYAMADVGVDAEDFYNGYFLSILQGPKLTAMGRLELLWYYGSDSATVTADYADGTTATMSAVMATSSGQYSCIDASPDHYTQTGKQLAAYTVQAGQRSQQFNIDPRRPDCAPILEFYNSFGVWELLYCTGTHKVAPEYKRESARIGGKLRNYRIEETRKFEADTGILTTPMAAWADELFRSVEVYVVNVYGGSVESRDAGKEVVITESKSEVTNEDDNLPHFSFTYQYAQRIHNVLQLNRVDRIFDNTFDHTFN